MTGGWTRGLLWDGDSDVQFSFELQAGTKAWKAGFSREVGTGKLDEGLEWNIGTGVSNEDEH